MRSSFRLLLVSTFITAGFLGAVEWSPLNPPFRSFSSLVVDTLNHRALLFGGDFSNEVWELSISQPTGYSWRRLEIAGTPPAGRWGHRMVYDPADQRMVLLCGTGSTGQLNDAWSLDVEAGNESWERLTPSGIGPSVRDLLYAAYHPGRRSVIVFGGAISGQRYNDLFELKLDSMVWRTISPSGTPPSQRSEGCACYDPHGDRLIIFGGRENVGFLNDVWSLSLAQGSETWNRLTPSGTPPCPRAGSAWGYYEAGNRLFVFGGWDYYGMYAFYDDLYELDVSASTWTRICPTGTLPEARRGAAGTYDPWNNNLLIAGGDGYDDCGDAWYTHLDPAAVAEWRPDPTDRVSPSLHIATVSRGAVRIRYILPGPGDATVRILDPVGRVVRELADGAMSESSGWLTWDGRDESGRSVATGTYYGYLQTATAGVSAKFTLTE